MQDEETWPPGAGVAQLGEQGRPSLLLPSLFYQQRPRELQRGGCRKPVTCNARTARGSSTARGLVNSSSEGALFLP